MKKTKENLSPMEMVTEYHETAGLDFGVHIEGYPYDGLSKLRYNLISEEIKELMAEFNTPVEDPIGPLLKEMADVVYVLYGWCVTFGSDLDEVLRRVHQNNIDRMYQDDGTILYREDGKIMKNPNTPKVDLSDLV